MTHPPQITAASNHAERAPLKGERKQDRLSKAASWQLALFSLLVYYSFFYLLSDNRSRPEHASPADGRVPCILCRPVPVFMLMNEME